MMSFWLSKLAQTNSLETFFCVFIFSGFSWKSLIFFRKSHFTSQANKWFELFVNFLDVLAHVAALTKLLVASRKRARERAIFSVQAHVVDKLRPVRKQLVAVASILALEKCRAVDVTVIQPAEAEHGEGLTAREHLLISWDGAEVEASSAHNPDQPARVDDWKVLNQLTLKATRHDHAER